MPITVTHVNKNSSNRIHSFQSNNHINFNEEEKFSNDSILKKTTMRSNTFSHTPIYPFIHETIKPLPPVHGIKTAYHNDSIKYKDKYFLNLTELSSNKSITSSKLLLTKSIIDYKKQTLKSKNHRDILPVFQIGIETSTNDIGLYKNKSKKRKNQNKKICPIYSNCCCCSISTFTSLLFLTGLTALLISLLTNQHRTTTTTISSTSITSSTSTSTTSITSTTSTSATSSTSTTSQTTTTSMTTTSTSTTSTSPTPPCIPTSVASASTLYSTSYGNLPSYTCFAYEWTSPTTGLVTLAFQLRNDPGIWSLDDVSIYAGADQMIINGDFETGSLSPWVRTTTSGSCGGAAAGGHVSTVSPHTGTYVLVDGSYGCADIISQQFNATAGQLYTISFWLKSSGVGSSVTASITLS